MSKGAQTRERVLRQAATLFNKQGYAGSSLADIMQATGLQKGGIYNHFESKENLALAAFDYAVGLVRERFAEALQAKHHAVDRLLAIMAVFQSYHTSPPIAGGCPVLNTAIEADDTNPLLRDRARAVMDEWRAMIERIVAKGIARGELKPTVEADELATLMITMLEGAVMLSKLYRDPVHMERAVNHLTAYVQSLRP